MNNKRKKINKIILSPTHWKKKKQRAERYNRSFLGVGSSGRGRT
jgi:hypothetical protein